MNTELHIEEFIFTGRQIRLYVPEPEKVKGRYLLQKEKDAGFPFPYWTQVWPAAIALAEFLSSHPQYIAGRTVLELAAGLGLPSLVAAFFARQVCCSDYLREPVEIMARSASLNGLHNLECRVLNWHQLPPDLQAEVLLLSDINYDPSEFDVLFHVLTEFMENGSTVILSTPQRLMAKPFIDRLLPWCTLQQEIEVDHQQKRTLISILTLKRQP